MQSRSKWWSRLSLSTSSETELQARDDESDDGHGSIGLGRQVSGFEVHCRVLGAARLSLV